MKILFISRSYPPTMGGMEEVSYQLATNFKRLTPTFIIANKKGKKFLPLFLPAALIRGLVLIKTNKITAVHLADGLLTPLGVIFKLIYKIPVTVTTHGLDVIYPNKLYQFLFPKCLEKMDYVFAVSQSTLNECLKRGVDVKRCSVIPNGVDLNKFKTNLSKKQLRQKLSRNTDIDLRGKKILISVGHLVKRKGFSWFIENVLPKLDKNVLYFVIGGYGNQSKGNEREKINLLINKLGLQKRVFPMGRIINEQLKVFYNTADLLIMPNIKVAGDTEGFGIVALEAAVCGLVTIASSIDGIKDAVRNNQNGFLVEPENDRSFVTRIDRMLRYPQERLNMGIKAQQYVKNYEWEKIAFLYLEEINKIQNRFATNKSDHIKKLYA